MKVNALAVASEPYIFWRGDDADSIIERIKIREEIGTLKAAASQYNGPSGVSLDDCFLSPLGISREKAWLCDLVPYSCVNKFQEIAIKRDYIDLIAQHELPPPSVPKLPKLLTDDKRRQEIKAEIEESKADYLILLGDQPIKWFLSEFDSVTQKDLRDFGCTSAEYGTIHKIQLGQKTMQVIPLTHPRQVSRLGKSSKFWHDLHSTWMTTTAIGLIRI